MEMCSGGETPVSGIIRARPVSGGRRQASSRPLRDGRTAARRYHNAPAVSSRSFGLGQSHNQETSMNHTVQSLQRQPFLT
jgi:hypothetical protein